MSELTPKEQLKKLVQIFDSALVDAEVFADEHGLDFRISPAYGMGGRYDGEEGQWYSSSAACQDNG